MRPLVRGDILTNHLESSITIGELKVSKEQEMYWSIDDNLRKLLRYGPSIEDMKLILRPMSFIQTGD